MGGEAETNYRIPLWTRLWFFATGIICTWDASFIIFRPHSLPGGKYSLFWKPYSIYVEVDKRYKDMTDPFVYAQSLMNYAEVVLGFAVLILNARNSKSTAALAFATSLMTLWKTVIYMLQYTDLCGGGHYHSHNDPLSNFLYLWLPNGIWITVPFLVVCSLWERISQGGTGRRSVVGDSAGGGDFFGEKNVSPADASSRSNQKNKKKKMY